MKITHFLSDYFKAKQSDKTVYYFCSKNPYTFFYSQLIKKLKSEKRNLLLFSCENFEWKVFESTLSTTFLGQKKVVLLSNISSVNLTIKKKILHFLASYSGPHTLLCFMNIKDSESIEQTLLCNLDTVLLKEEIEMIMILFFGHCSISFLHLIKNHYKTMTVDSVLLLAHYNAVLGKDRLVFSQKWYPKIIVSEQSLFALAQYFFARNKKLFFTLWNQIKDTYPPAFWSIFWSEQLFKAFYFITLQQEGNFNQAKSMGYKLPFSFLKKDFKVISTSELKKAHLFLYQNDQSLKQGGLSIGLELFYYKFLEKKFI